MEGTQARSATKPDVIVLGAGPAGLTAAALLARQGRDVLVLEESPRLGGFSATVEIDGFTLNLGSHVLEDPGSGITRVFEQLGLRLDHAAMSSDLPVWDHDREAWSSIRERYSGSRQELKAVIHAIVSSPFEAFDEWDDRCLREWLWQHTHDQGVIDLFEYLAFVEFLTRHWWDHSASDALYLRKLHYGERGTAGYSAWPAQGWADMFRDLASAITTRGGVIRTGVPGGGQVVLEGGAVRGVRVAADGGPLPNEITDPEIIEADCVVVARPVWELLDVLPEQALPDWFAAQVRHLSQPRFRASWVNVALATEVPVPVVDRRELATWMRSPRHGLAGFAFEQTAYDPGTAPAGTHLYVAGAAIEGHRAHDQAHVRQIAQALEEDLAVMFPGLDRPVWRRRQLVFDPSIGLVSKPTLVGRFRPGAEIPGAEGLYLAHETLRSRGIEDDRAARAALTAVEAILGRRLPGFEATWRY